MFKDRLQDLRKDRGISQAALGGLIGVSQQAIWKWEAGINEPGNEKLLAIANLFDVSTDYLLGRSDNPNYYRHDIDNDGHVFSKEKDPLTPEKRGQILEVVESTQRDEDSVVALVGDLRKDVATLSP